MENPSIENSEYCKYIDNKSDVLFVWFGGINEPFFSEKFAEMSGFDCIYFKDTDYDWYTNGVSGTPYTKDTLIVLLRDYKNKYKFICLCGQSSGGYAALYYGIRAPSHLCIAYSPQTRNTFDGQCKMTPHVRIENINDLYEISDKKPHIILNVSRSEKDHSDEFEWRDHDQIAELKMKDRVTTIIHPHDNHAVSVILREKGILYNSLISTIETYRLHQEII